MASIEKENLPSSLSKDKSAYRQLDAGRREIRLLTIAPGLWHKLDDTLKCKIRHVSLDEVDHFASAKTTGSTESPGTRDDLTLAGSRQVYSISQRYDELDHTQEFDVDELFGEQPEYETISYAWGDAKKRASILLDGVPFDVPRSSEQALRRMRLPDRPRTVWIDAVCINQEDDGERSLQVEIMADIYRGGTQNLIYLGEAPESTRSALDSIDLLIKTEIADVIKDGKTFVDIMIAPDGRWRFDPAPVSVPVDRDALAELYSRPWFSRLWVLQEMARAKHNICMCGPFYINFQSTLMAAAWLVYKLVLMPASHRDLAANMLEYVDSPHSAFRQGRFVIDLNNLLNTSQDAICTDPRDKVYVVIGLVDWSTYGGLPEDLKPDYSQSVSNVLGMAASWMIRSSNLNIAEHLLRNITHRSNKDLHLDGLPTWVPRWHRPWDFRKESLPFRSNWKGNMTKLSAKSSPVVSEETHQSLRLKWAVQGILLGGIEEIYPGLGANFGWKGFPRRYIDPCRRLLLKFNRDVDVEAELCNILTASTWHDYGPLRESHTEILRMWMADEMEFSTPFSSKATHDIECSSAVLYACCLRAIAKLQGGNPALVPHITVKGDVMVWIIGSDYPAVLRPCGEEYQVIGQAYVHGVMNGEAIDAWGESGEELRTFVLI